MMRWVGRSVLSLLGATFLLGTAYFGAQFSIQHQQIRKLQQEKAELEAIIDRLGTNTRVAQLYVADQKTDGRGKVVSSTLQFKEYDRGGRPMPARSIDVPSDVIYIDALVVRFQDDYVGRNDELRGHSLHLFRRVFGDTQRPQDGTALDTPNEVPQIYQTSTEPSEFERALWRDFWQFASDPDAAAAMGVRVAQGEAVYQRVRTGQTWELSTRPAGGLEFQPERATPLMDSHSKGGATP
jgi:hypothetical protein